MPFDLNPVVSRSFAISAFATEDEVRRAVLEWSREMGWVQERPILAFRTDGLTGFFVTVEVVLEARDGHTLANFTASHPYPRNPESDAHGAIFVGGLERVARMFGGGVSMVLGRHGMRTTPRSFLNVYEVDRFKRIDLWSNRLIWPLLVIGVGAFVSIKLAREAAHTDWVVLGAITWLAATVVTRIQAHSRIFGISRAWAFYFTIICWLCVVLFAALALFLP